MLINAQLDITQIIEIDKRLTDVEKKLQSKHYPASPYATIQDAMKYLNCSYSKVRRLIDRGFLKKNLDSRHIQLLWSSIYAYVQTTASN
jgi:hypothetical protein